MGLWRRWRAWREQRRRQRRQPAWRPYGRIPDGDTAPVPGWPRPHRPVAATESLNEPTQILPTLLLTRAGMWRANGGHWRDQTGGWAR